MENKLFPMAELKTLLAWLSRQWIPDDGTATADKALRKWVKAQEVANEPK